MPMARRFISDVYGHCGIRRDGACGAPQGCPGEYVYKYLHQIFRDPRSAVPRQGLTVERLRELGF
jgi:hypothetical protein